MWEALRVVNALPRRVQDVVDLQRTVQRHLERCRAVDDLHCWCVAEAEPSGAIFGCGAGAGGCDVSRHDLDCDAL